MSGDSVILPVPDYLASAAAFFVSG